MKTLTANYYGEQRQLTVMTCQRAKMRGATPSRSYGYTIFIQPPIEFTTNGQDVEGIGWYPHAPKLHVQRCHGWYKYKSDAVKRVEDLAKCVDR